MPICIREGCDRNAVARFLCHRHITAARRNGEELPPPMKRLGGPCIADGCERPRSFLQRCTLHAQRFRKYGSDDLPQVSDDERFDRSWVLDPQTGCHLWLRAIDKGGYGHFCPAGRRSIRAHRYAWIRKHGPVPTGLVLDHIVCDNPRCCNAEHLVAVTNQVNTRRDPLSPHGINSRKTHCIRGHEFTKENTYWRPDGRGRNCRACLKDRQARNRKHTTMGPADHIGRADQLSKRGTL